MPQQKRKKLSLEEARALFNDSPSKSPRNNSRKRPHQQNKPRSNRAPPRDLAQIENRISMLERRVMEGDLSADEEAKILSEIERLEKNRS